MNLNNICESHDHAAAIKEESILFDQLLEEDCKIGLKGNISVAQRQPGESISNNEPLQSVKRKKSCHKKKPMKRQNIETEYQDEHKIGEKDGAKARSNSEDGECSSHSSSLTPSSSSACNFLLERILNEKKLALLSSPEVIQLLQARMGEKNKTKQSSKQEL